MALNRNLHILEGRLGKDAEVSYTAAGKAVCKVSVATSHWDGQQNVTDWHNCIILGRQAEYIGEHGKKGGEIALVGRSQTRKWQDKSGQDRYTTETVCFEADLVSAGNRENNDQGSYDGGYKAGSQPQGRNAYAEQSGGRAADPYNDPNSDIPF